jgi:hypothetical protein
MLEQSSTYSRMNKSKIFISFQEPQSIKEVVSHIPGSDDFISKLRIYMTSRVNQFITSHNKYLAFKEYEIYKSTVQPNYIYAIVITKTNVNHPYMMFLDINSNLITFLIPFGKDYRQADMDEYKAAIPECTIAELEAIYLILDKTIYIRKKGILDSRQFSLLDCSNISNCKKKMQEIDKMGIGIREKQELKARYVDAYLHKALDFLKYYFDLLDAREYDEAWEFLKGTKGRYQGRQRLNTFFKNTKSIIGHLEIFVLLYEIFHLARERIYGF